MIIKEIWAVHSVEDFTVRVVPAMVEYYKAHGVPLTKQKTSKIPTLYTKDQIAKFGVWEDHFYYDEKDIPREIK